MNGLKVERQGVIMRVTLDRPPVNALGRDLLEALSEAIDAAAADPAVSVLHIRNAGRCFCAGADLAEMRVGFSGPEGAAAQLAFVGRLQEVFARLETLEAVSIAEIGGHALGGGLELALACDLRVAAREARLGLPEVELGLVPGAGGTQRLTRLCGPTLAKRLILGAEVVDGLTAAELGIVHWAVPASELADHARILADRIAGLPRAALAGAKACIGLAASGDGAGFQAELDVTRRLMDEPETRRRVKEFLSR